jgi:hypothetical protein
MDILYIVDNIGINNNANIEAKGLINTKFVIVPNKDMKTIQGKIFVVKNIIDFC